MYLTELTIFTMLFNQWRFLVLGWSETNPVVSLVVNRIIVRDEHVADHEVVFHAFVIELHYSLGSFTGATFLGLVISLSRHPTKERQCIFDAIDHIRDLWQVNKLFICAWEWLVIF